MRAGSVQSRMIFLPRSAARYGLPRERATNALASRSVILVCSQASLSDRRCPEINSIVRPQMINEPLLLCTHCNVEMCLFGIESESAKRDLYTFECIGCGALGVRGVQIR